MSAYHIREAHSQDLEGVSEIFSLTHALHRQAHPEIFQEAGDPNDIKDYLLTGIQTDDAVIFVAEANGEIIGAILAILRQPAEISVLVQRTYASIENLVVAEAYRQQGVAQSLMNQVVLWAQARGLKEIQLTVWDFNQPAITFYEKLGYEMLHHRMRKELP